MLNVFVDTAAWIALLNVSDLLHARVKQVMQGLHQQNARLVTTEFVLMEVADALSAPTIRTQTVGFHQRFKTTTHLANHTRRSNLAGRWLDALQ